MLEFAKKVAREAGALIEEKRHQELKIDEKDIQDFVTNADKEAEELITKRIKEHYPTHAILGEESSDLSNEEKIKELISAKYIWIIDPIDGTTNYIQNIPAYCVSIGLFKTKNAEQSKNFQYLEGEIELGVVYSPQMNQLFHAQKGSGAFENDQQIHVSSKEKIEDAIAATGFIRHFRNKNFPYFQSIQMQALGVRRLGSAALDLCYLASGRFDIFWEFGLKPWDIAAGSLILQEAGGFLSDTNGNTLDLFGQDLLATNKLLHPKVLDTFSKL